MGRAERITRVIQGHDDKLYCQRDTTGMLSIFRKTYRVETYFLDDSTVIHSVRSAPHFVCALTHNWKASGRPVDWGLEPILKHVRSNDLWSRDIVSDLEKQEDEHIASLERRRRTSMESFFSDSRNAFKEQFKDVNTANMDKKKQTKHLYKEK